MVNLTWLNIDFIRVLEIAGEIGRVTIALGFRPPPPTYTFHGLEPLYKDCIDHYQRRCDEKYREITSAEPGKDGDTEIVAADMEQKRFDELEVLLQKHSRLVNDLKSMMENPHLHHRKHSDEFEKPLEPGEIALGPERYIDPPAKGYGFSNDYIRHLLAAIPGRLGRHFETEEAGSVHLTAIFQQILIAITGGAALLTPMIIMTFVTGIHWRLIIVSIATLLFGTAFAIVSSSKENVLAGTAAYAAVMVVYIGSSSQNAPS